MPFTVEQFFAVFGQYNLGVWPVPLLLYALALGCAVLTVMGPSWSGRLVAAVLGGLWAWSGIVYHLSYFIRVESAAFAFGLLFLAQAVAFWWAGTIRGRLSFDATRSSWESLFGWGLVLYALVVYPLLNRLAGHRFPETPTFGTPCPVTLFTLGVLFLAQGELPRGLVLLPLIWAMVGSVAAIRLAVPADYALLIAAVVSLSLLRPRRAST